MNKFKFAFLVVSAGFVLALSGCNQPDNRAEVRHAYQMADMWKQQELCALECKFPGKCMPTGPGSHVGEDTANGNYEAWTAYANSIK